MKTHNDNYNNYNNIDKYYNKIIRYAVIITIEDDEFSIFDILFTIIMCYELVAKNGR